jgi:eukaryotic-like serine/threonine-protein kinase
VAGTESGTPDPTKDPTSDLPGKIADVLPTETQRLVSSKPAVASANQTKLSEGPRLTIQLAREWTFSEFDRIGTPGGFGDVFEGQGEDGAKVAVKRIKRVTPGLATGEIRIAYLLMPHKHEHIIPILDAGKDPESGHSYVIMPLAKESLQDRLDREGPLADDEAMRVFQDILTGLQELKHVVHGDLNPANVLSHEGKWKLADMGIARHLDDAPRSLSNRMFFSEAYGAPEQWRFETATRATDVYAFGCLTYTVLTGLPPFLGPSQEEYCLQHLKGTPRLLTASPAVRALAQMCLAKDRAARPSIDTAMVLLKRAWGK